MRKQYLLLVSAVAVLGGVFYWMRSSVRDLGGGQTAGAEESHAVPRIPASQANLPDAGFDFSIRSMDGRTIPFSDFKGKTIFLNFWATWCGPCREEMPSIE